MHEALAGSRLRCCRVGTACGWLADWLAGWNVRKIRRGAWLGRAEKIAGHCCAPSRCRRLTSRLLSPAQDDHRGEEAQEDAADELDMMFQKSRRRPAESEVDAKATVENLLAQVCAWLAARSASARWALGVSATRRWADQRAPFPSRTQMEVAVEEDMRNYEEGASVLGRCESQGHASTCHSPRLAVPRPRMSHRCPDPIVSQARLPCTSFGS